MLYPVEYPEPPIKSCAIAIEGIVQGAGRGASGKIGHRFYFKPEEVEPYREHKEVFAP